MNWDEPLAFALALADQVGKHLVARLDQVTAATKHDGSLVSEADIEADHLIHDAIRARFPDHGIVSEELTHEVGEEAFQWVVDPIDGTTNYLSGLPIWGVLLALLHQGRPVLTVGESPRFIRDGGMINLLLIRNTVRFEVNLEAASRAGLTSMILRRTKNL